MPQVVKRPGAPLVKATNKGHEAVSPKVDRTVIDRRLFDLMTERAVVAEDLCKRLLDYIARDDGQWRAEYGDYAEAARALLD